MKIRKVTKVEWCVSISIHTFNSLEAVPCVPREHEIFKSQPGNEAREAR